MIIELVVLLALLVLCVVEVANRELAALDGQIAELEAGGWSALPEDGVAAVPDLGFRRCSERATVFFVCFVCFAALLLAS